jgi:hypothetical protein
MKISKGLAIFSLTCVVFSSCFDPPQFPIVPQIEFDKIEFIRGQTDELVLSIRFKDGDGDVGLDNSDSRYIDSPYNNSFFFQEHNGILDTISTIVKVFPGVQTQYDLLDIKNPANGKLVFPRTRKNPAYSSLPAYNCADYEYLVDHKLLIRKADHAVLDPTVRITNTLGVAPDDYLEIQDTLLMATNPNHYNIEIDFLVKRGDNDFVEFDWRKEFCTQSYDGRFPVLTDSPRALEGIIRYSMKSVGFRNIFSTKVLKLRVQIKDRALHRSNTILTPEFTL